MFKEFERYIKIMKMFKGIDWTIYVKMRNKERKNNDPKQDYDNENLLDEDIEEELEKLAKLTKEQQDAKEETKMSNEEPIKV